MEVEDMEKLEKNKTIFLRRLSQDYRGVVIDTVNKAFGRNYSIKDELEIVSYKAMAIKTDRVRVYECKFAYSFSGELVLCLIEREHAGVAEEAVICCNELLLDMGSPVLIIPKDSSHKKEKMRCVIDTPGGAIKFAIPSIEVDYESGQIMKRIKLWTE